MFASRLASWQNGSKQDASVSVRKFPQPGSRLWNGKGRGFGTTGGHYHATWDSDNWRTLVLNAITWTSGVAVPEKGVPSAKNPVSGAK